MDPVIRELLDRYLKTSEGRHKIVEASEWAMNHLQKLQRVQPEFYSKIGDVLAEVRDRSGAGEAYEPLLTECLRRCAVG